jgi:hypothetical protein
MEARRREPVNRLLVLFQSDDGGYYGHGTHGKTRKETIPDFNNIVVFFRGFRGYWRNTDTRLDSSTSIIF